MAGVKGRSGTNKGQDKPWREAIMLAVKESDGDAHKLRKLARALVTAGIAGDVSALREIGDRLDGKPTQAVTGELTGTFTVISGVPRANG